MGLIKENIVANSDLVINSSDKSVVDDTDKSLDKKLSADIALHSMKSCCLCCGALVEFDEDYNFVDKESENIENKLSNKQKICSHCFGKVSLRKTNSLSRTWALLVAAIIFIIPANILPITKASYFAGEQSDTILSGILYLWKTGSYPVAIIVFLASFVTPIFKIISLLYLCYTCQKKSTKNVVFRSKLYHFTEMIGRWSMVDVFVVALLSAMVQMGALATMNAGPGVIAFLFVVVFSMTAAETFDSRLIWDDFNEQYRK